MLKHVDFFMASNTRLRMPVFIMHPSLFLSLIVVLIAITSCDNQDNERKLNGEVAWEAFESLSKPSANYAPLFYAYRDSLIGIERKYYDSPKFWFQINLPADAVGRLREELPRSCIDLVSRDLGVITHSSFKPTNTVGQDVNPMDWLVNEIAQPSYVFEIKFRSSVDKYGFDMGTLFVYSPNDTRVFIAHWTH